MHPALSVIFFTVVSGAGFGLVILTVSLGVLGGVPGLGATGVLTALFVGVVLATAGLMASTLHLANPKNAWRAFFRFRTSWLSREAVFSVLFYPCVMLYMFGLWRTGGVNGLGMTIVGLLVLSLALATVFTTGMIYASLRTIPQWNSPLVPTNYLLLSLASGAVLLTGVTVFFGETPELIARLALVLLVVAGMAKAVYYFWIGKPQGPTINAAIGPTRARIRMLESGQSSDSFLNREFSYEADAYKIKQLRLVVYVCAFLLPFAFLVMLLSTEAMAVSLVLALGASALLLVGLLVERWLFFAEARHVVNLFYGRQQC